MITLVLGGTRSGKSATAEAIAEALDQPITYIATAVVDPADADHQRRIAAHQARRPDGWHTVDCEAAADLPRRLEAAAGPVLVDSLGSWVALHPDLVVDPSNLLRVMAQRHDPTIVVSEEVGLAVHAPTEIGRRYVDAMGLLNQRVAKIADNVLLVVAGRIIELAPFDAGRFQP